MCKDLKKSKKNLKKQQPIRKKIGKNKTHFTDEEIWMANKHWKYAQSV